MRRLSERQRFLVSDKIFDLANIAAGALIFGHYLSGAEFSWARMGAGAAFYLIVFIISLTLTTE